MWSRINRQNPFLYLFWSDPNETFFFFLSNVEWWHFGNVPYTAHNRVINIGDVFHRQYLSTYK